MKFNPEDYSTVEERLVAARKDHPEMVVDTMLVSSVAVPAAESLRWVFRCDLYKSPEDRKGGLLWSSGWASEVDGLGGPVNKTSACENAETSAIGRALANAGYSGDKRASREEMEKVRRYEAAEKKLLEAVQAADSKDGLTKLWNYAAGNGLVRSEAVSEAFRRRGEALKE
nr:MAG TPA: hypothetical protein [Caudoviricetes sp.]